MWVKASSNVPPSFSASLVWTKNQLIRVSLKAQRENRHLLDGDAKLAVGSRRRARKNVELELLKGMKSSREIQCVCAVGEKGMSRHDKSRIYYLHIFQAFGAANQQLMVRSQTLPVKLSQQYHLWKKPQRLKLIVIALSDITTVDAGSMMSHVSSQD